MNEATLARPVRGRSAKQSRSLERRARIADAAVALIAERGIAGITHRLVAERAGVSLAATTYYYATKFDILAEAANSSMQHYADAFARAAERYRASGGGASAFRDFAFRLIRNAAGVHRAGTIAWAEISLDAARHPESLVLARNWTAHINRQWTDIAEVLGFEAPGQIARSGIDTVIGLILMTVALGLTHEALDAVLENGTDPLKAWASCAGAGAAKPAPASCGRKAHETRERIVDAAIEILMSDGPAAISFRQIAARAGLTPAAPAYHFTTIEELLRVAQARLFAQSKARYRNAVTGLSRRHLALEPLIELTAVVFQREATENGGRNIATFAIWLEAARRPELRAMVWDAVADQCQAWQRLLNPLCVNPDPVNGLLAQAMFLGKLVRLLSTGAQTSDLVHVRGEFACDLKALCAGSFWAQRQKTGTNRQRRLTG